MPQVANDVHHARPAPNQESGERILSRVPGHFPAHEVAIPGALFVRALAEHGGRRENEYPRLLSDLEKRLDPDRSVFLCTHLDNVSHALTYEPPFSKFSIGHWGAVDGSNEWKEYDTAVNLRPLVPGSGGAQQYLLRPSRLPK
jgi:hypothetical protein